MTMLLLMEHNQCIKCSHCLLSQKKPTHNNTTLLQHPCIYILNKMAMAYVVVNIGQ